MKALRLLILLLVATNAFAITAHIEVMPGTTVEVGEEVCFDASGSEDDKPLQNPTYSDPQSLVEWDLGDGKVCGLGENDDGGMAISHFYMEPGEYRVELHFWDTDGNFDSTSVTMTVTGEAVMDGFEIWRADYHGRIAQYLYIQIPNSVHLNAANSLRVTLTSDQGYDETLLDKANLGAEEVILLRNASLPVGNYVLRAELLDTGDNVISFIREKFPKAYEGMPHVGINEHNAVCIDGEPYFPITPYLCNVSTISQWMSYGENGSINSLYGMGWYADGNTVDTWSDYLDQAESRGLHMIGPERWEGKAGINYWRNSCLNKIAEYVEQTRDHSALTMWCWGDEPDIGGDSEYVPPEVQRAWTYVSHSLDAQHLTATNYVGPYYCKGAWHLARAQKFCYLYSDARYGKKTHPHDVIGMDYYPYDWTWATVEKYAVTLDLMKEYNYDLVPYMSYVETGDINDDPDTPAPTPEQVKHLVWLAIVHGAKGINYFPYFSGTTAENYVAVGELCDQITPLAPVILNPVSDIPVTVNVADTGARVDITVREKDGCLYIFAVRLTEPEIAQSDPGVDVTFTVGSGAYDVCEVIDEDRTNAVTDSNSFGDAFAPNDVHLYKVYKASSISDNLMQGSAEHKIRITPDPFSSEFLLPGDLRIHESGIYTTSGRRIEGWVRRGNAIQLSGEVAEGMYVLKLETAQGNYISNIIKRK